MREKLKPCPFCGGKAHLESRHRAFINAKTTRVAYVRCLNCNARTERIPLEKYGKISRSAMAEAEAINAWNRRVKNKDCSQIIELPCKVGDLIDTVISHNEIVGIWEMQNSKEIIREHTLLWKGMAHEIPEEYLDRTFLNIFGTIPIKISEADTVNIAVTQILKESEQE